MLRSGFERDQLSKYSEEIGCSLKLVLDVTTRWSSTLRMLRNFNALQVPLRKLYEDGSRPGTFPFSDEDVLLMQELISALNHVEEATKRLSRKDATMRSADLALEVSSELEQQKLVLPLEF